jgi:hypothetical protein
MAMKITQIEPVSGDVAVSSANAAASVVYTGSPNYQRHLIYAVHASYSGEPTGGELLIKDADNENVYRQAITANNLTVDFVLPISSPPGKGISVVLAAGGSGIIGTLSVLHAMKKD